MNLNIQSVLSLMLIVVSVSVITIISTRAAQAEDLKYQELTRILPPVTKKYPILDSLERELYPNQNFKDDNPSHRLERLEIAMFGTRQSGTIGDRLEKLRNEVNNWQIANAEPIKNTKATNTIDPAEKAALKAQERSQIADERLRYSRFLMQERAKTREANNIARMTNPLVQRLGKQSIESIFGGNK